MSERIDSKASKTGKEKAEKRASMKLVLTKDDERQLADLGYSSGQVKKLKPEEAADIIKHQKTAPKKKDKEDGSPVQKKEIQQEQKKAEKKVYTAAVIETTKLVEAQARDIGDHRMTESKEDRSKGWFRKTITRIWKHNLFQEYYRQSEIAKARKEILDSGNLYADEKGLESGAHHHEAIGAVIERFTSEYEAEMLTKEEKESKKTVTDAGVNAQIKELVKQYAANPNMSEAAFEEEGVRILSAFDKEYANKNKAHATNILDIAKEVRESIAHGEKLAELDFEVNIILGEAQESLKTKPNFNVVDKVTEKIKNSKIGILLDETTIASAVAIAFSVGSFAGNKLLRSKAGQIATFGGTAVAAGAIASMKESARLTRERAQDAREIAKGMTFTEEDMKRRQEMEEARYEIKSASQITKTLESALARVQLGNIDQTEMESITGSLADLEARIQLGDKNKIDLIGYSSAGTLEVERKNLDLARARLKVALRKGIEAKTVAFMQGGTFDQFLAKVTDVSMNTLEDKEVDVKDRTFRKLKAKRVVGAFVKTVLIGATIGTVLQEGRAFFDGEKDGIIEGAVKSVRNHLSGGKVKEFLEDRTGDFDKHTTALEALRRTVFGESPRMPFGEGHEVMLGAEHMSLPDGVDITKNPDGTFDILRNGEIISDNTPLEFTENGDLSQASKDLLAEQGIFSTLTSLATQTTETVHEPASDYLQEHGEGTHRIHRELWYDNDTPKPLFDKNELRQWWGGENGTGIDANGNYVFNMQHMTADGSYHNGLSINAQEALKNGTVLKMVFSLSQDTQHQVFEVPIDAAGNAIIDPESPVGKLMFETDANGHAVFTGRFAEVVQSMGEAPDGGENLRVLSTVVGEGKDFIDHEVIKDTFEKGVRLDVPDDWDWDMPPFMPLVPRRPLERGGYAPASDKERGKYGLVGGVYDETYLDRDAMYEDPTYGEALLASTYEDESYQDAVGGVYDESMRGKEGKRTLDKQGIERYIQTMSGYMEKRANLQLLKELDAQIGEPMSNDARMSIVLPCYKEGENVYKTLSDWTLAQKDLKPEEIEIITFVNAPKKNQPLDQKTISEIERFQREHPEYKIRLVKHNFDFQSVKMGSVYKAPTDLALYRNLKRLETGASKEDVAGHLLRAGGADALGRNPRFLREVIDYMGDHPETEQLRTQSAYPPEVREKFPLFNVMTVFNHSLSHLYTRGMSNIGLGTFRARVYAEAGGFDPARTSREEIDLGIKIREKVGKNKNAINKLVKKNAIDNPRRELFALARGETVLRAYTGFTDEKRDAALRVFDWNKELPESFKKNIELNKENMTREFDAYFQHYLGKVKKESGVISKILSGELNVKSLRLHPETRLLLKDPEILALIEKINDARTSGRKITRSSEEGTKLAEQITKQLFDRILRTVFKFKKGEDYSYMKEGDGVHLAFNQKAIEKVIKASQVKWENFDGYWNEKEKKSSNTSPKTKESTITTTEENKAEVPKEKKPSASLEKSSVPMDSKTDFVYGLMTGSPDALRMQVEARKNLFGGGMYKQPAFIIFESNPSSRDALINEMNALQKEYPEAHFEYIETPQGTDREEMEKDTDTYMRKILGDKRAEAGISSDLLTFAEKIG